MLLGLLFFLPETARSNPAIFIENTLCKNSIMGCGCKKKKQPVVTQESTNTETSTSSPVVVKVEEIKES